MTKLAALVCVLVSVLVVGCTCHGMDQSSSQATSYKAEK
jgi:hypothetical protein